MLTRLLGLVAGGRGVVTIPEMARELGIGRGLVEAMVADASRLGYLSQVENRGCHQPCSECMVHATCGMAPQSGYWLLTEKGARLLDKG